MSGFPRILIFFATVFVTTAAMAQVSSQNASANTSCTFKDGMQMSVRYDPAPIKHELKEGALWRPGGSPMYLFTSTDVTLAGTHIPAGAYSLYIIPGASEWTLVVNKDVNKGAAYDSSQDLARVKMETGHLSSTDEHAKVVFGHVADRQCNMRIYAANVAGFTEFKER